MSALADIPPAGGNNLQHYRASTDAAELCKAIVVATSKNISGRNYVPVEGWQAIAMAHGCTASAVDVQRVDGGVRATGQVRRMSDGFVIAEAEGFVGEDEEVWFGGTVTDRWNRTKTLPRRKDYGIRAMAQTRAISRACRSAFAHVVVMMNANLQTTPAEEVPEGGFQDQHDDRGQQRDDDTNGPRPNRDAAVQRMREEDDRRDPANFSVADSMLTVMAGMDAARNKAGLDLAWRDHRALRSKIMHHEPEQHERLVAHFAQRANAIAAALAEMEARNQPPADTTDAADTPPAGEQTIDVKPTRTAQHDDVLDDDVPYS